MAKIDIETIDLVNEKYPIAKYTMSFLAFKDATGDWLKDSLVLDTDEHTVDFQTMLSSVWNVWEIAGETIGEEKEFLLGTFNAYKREYIEKVNAYEKEFDFEKAIKSTETVSSSSERKDDFTRTDALSREERNLFSDLPNKKVTADDLYGYPTSAEKNVSENTGTQNNAGSRDEKGESTREVTNWGGYLSAKKAYIAQINDYWRDFAMRFSDCFLHLF